jgi:hypothetical protein
MRPFEIGIAVVEFDVVVSTRVTFYVGKDPILKVLAIKVHARFVIMAFVTMPCYHVFATDVLGDVHERDVIFKVLDIFPGCPVPCIDLRQVVYVVCHVHLIVNMSYTLISFVTF